MDAVLVTVCRAPCLRHEVGGCEHKCAIRRIMTVRKANLEESLRNSQPEGQPQVDVLPSATEQAAISVSHVVKQRRTVQPQQSPGTCFPSVILCLITLNSARIYNIRCACVDSCTASGKKSLQWRSFACAKLTAATPPTASSTRGTGEAG